MATLWKVDSDSIDYKRAFKYLINRKVTIKDIVKHRIGYCSHGQWSGYLIFPVFNQDNELTYFSARAFDAFKPPHKLPEFDKNVIPDEWLINWSLPITLCESKLDAITIRRNAIPMYGKVPSDRLKEQIIKSPCNDRMYDF